jgi:hypothetical protein
MLVKGGLDQANLLEAWFATIGDRPDGSRQAEIITHHPK